jgi:hypothetical protein
MARGVSLHVGISEVDLAQAGLLTGRRFEPDFEQPDFHDHRLT